MGYRNWLDSMFVASVFWLAYAFFYAVHYFSGHMADWDSYWRVIMITVMSANFVVGPILTVLLGRIMYARGKAGVE